MNQVHAIAFSIKLREDIRIMPKNRLIVQQ